MLLHDFLDHVDGMVAREQRHIYGNIDDPLLGGFLDAFCDKVHVYTHASAGVSSVVRDMEVFLSAILYLSECSFQVSMYSFFVCNVFLLSCCKLSLGVICLFLCALYRFSMFFAYGVC